MKPIISIKMNTKDYIWEQILQLIYKYWLSIEPAIFVSLAGHISSETDILSQVHFPG